MGIRRQSLLVGAALSLLASATNAGELPAIPAGLEELGAGTAAEALDGRTLRLADGRILRLAGIEAPAPPLGWGAKPHEATPWRAAEAARAALGKLAGQGEIRLFASGFESRRGLRRDRHGRLLAQAMSSGDVWLQGALLVRGMARVYTMPADGALGGQLYAAEDEARLARRGIWADPYYAVRCAGEMNNATDATQVVQGRVLAVAEVRGALYLNFGADWRRDFTIRVERRDRRRLGWREAPRDLEGAPVEVRGWVYWFNGPAVDLDHGARIRILEDGSPLRIEACLGPAG